MDSQAPPQLAPPNVYITTMPDGVVEQPVAEMTLLISTYSGIEEYSSARVRTEKTTGVVYLRGGHEILPRNR